MRHPFFSRSGSTRSGLLAALVLVAATIAVSSILWRPETWRPEIRPDPPRITTPPADEMTQISECFTAMRGEGAHKSMLPLRRAPLARWSDPNNNVMEAAVWAWGERGRPLALLMMERNSDTGLRGGQESWGFEWVLFADESLDVEGSNEVRARNAPGGDVSQPVFSGAIHWNPQPPGLTFRDVPNAPRPAQSAPERLAQMREILGRFSAFAHPTGPPTELRLMPEPIERYSDREAGQLDGAIFFFAIGDNPEVMVLLEAQGPTPDQASWSYAAAPATVAPIEVAIDGKEVWRKGYHSEKLNTPSGSYFAVRMPRAKP